jgi:anthranilate synthase/aminodeoxychorismate synthase-like glutamine amidotransferase
LILLIDNYDSFTYNVYQCIEALGFKCQVVRNDAITLDEIQNLGPDKIVLSPGPGDPSSAGITLAVIEKFAPSIPILGVCLGHQAIGQAFGGKVIRAPIPKHGKLSSVTHHKTGIYQGVSEPFTAARYHSLILERETLPDCLEITSECDDGIIMGVKHRRFQVEGVQFHPESIATEEGAKIIENFLKQGSKS